MGVRVGDEIRESYSGRVGREDRAKHLGLSHDREEPNWGNAEPSEIVRYVTTNFHGRLPDRVVRAKALLVELRGEQPSEHWERASDRLDDVERTMLSHFGREREVTFPRIVSIHRAHCAARGSIDPQGDTERGSIHVALESSLDGHGQMLEALRDLRSAMGDREKRGSQVRRERLDEALDAIEDDVVRNIEVETRALLSSRASHPNRVIRQSNSGSA